MILPPHPIPTFDESEEAFGAPPPHEGITAVAHRLLAVSDSCNPMDDLVECVRLADELAGDCYGETLALSIAIGSGGADYDTLRDHFHRVARVGEARMLSHLAQCCLAQMMQRQGVGGHA